jgi:hypothetical protein
MSAKENLSLQNLKKSPGLRVVLLITQILLPLGLYAALRWSNTAAAALIAVLIVTGMIFLVWLG